MVKKLKISGKLPNMYREKGYRPGTDVYGSGDDGGDRVNQTTVAPTEEDYVASLVHRTLEGQRLLVVSFFLDAEEFALEVTEAVEVLKPRALTTVPRTPEFVKGILSVRGEMVPVVDLKRRLTVGSFDDSAPGRVLVAAMDDVKAGFIVDRMAGVEEIPRKAISPPDGAGERFPRGMLKGIINMAGREIKLLNTDNLLDFEPS